MNKKYNLLLPIAGKAQRFINDGYTVPKPLIMANSKHIIDWSMDSVRMDECNIIFVVRLDHIHNFGIDSILKQKFGNNIEIVVVDHITEGAVSTCLLAKKHIDNELPLVIYTPDVYFQPQFDPGSIPSKLDGAIVTFKANSPAHSYAQTDKDGYVVKTAEKDVISQDAAVGVYYFRTGRQFVRYAEEMIERNIRVNNEFYICPVYNLMLKDNAKIKIHPSEQMHVLGTPEELKFFIDWVVTKFDQRPVGVCCDHSGFKLKENALKILTEHNIEYIDFGTYINKDCDYSDYVLQVTTAIKSKVCGYGLGFCRTGQGINMLANSIPGIRAALVHDKYMATMAVRHNCANFFCVPEKYVTSSTLSDMVGMWKTTSFDGGRHMTRVKAGIDKL